MDDQNNKKDFDDFFRKNEDAQGAADQNESGTNAESVVSSETPEQAAKPSYYYSYGPYKSNSQESGASSQADYEANKPKLIQDQPYGNTGGSSASSSAFGLGQEVKEEAIVEPSNAAPRAPQQSQIRSFTPSPQSAKGSWQVREQRRTSFRAMFLSFLVGVLLVGSLMYAADMNNWFTNGKTMTTNTQSNGSGAGSSTAAGTGSSSGAATVAARPDNIAQLFETASPAVVKIETYVNTAKRSNSGSMLDDSFFPPIFWR